MRHWFYALCLFGYILGACDSRESSPGTISRDFIPPREATDPVPEPPTQPDTSRDSSARPEESLRDRTNATAEIHYRLTGTEPFWSLTLGRPYSTFRSMEGDSLSFAYTAPTPAAGRPQEWAQLFPLGEEGWALIRKGSTPCSDGMSDREWTYTATVWIQGRLLDGCAQKE
jgi:uncharacterized membrane protein